MDKEKIVEQILSESLTKADAEFWAEYKAMGRFISNVPQRQSKILAQWVMEARHDALSAVNELAAFRKQATNDLKQFAGKHRRLHDRKEKLKKLGIIPGEVDFQ